MDIKSLISLWNHTQQHPGTSGARACAGVLLGLYNGSRFPFDLTELRLLDKPLREAAIDVIEADATRCQREVHEWLRIAAAGLSFGVRFEWLAADYKCFKRGAMTLKALREEYGERPRSLVIQEPSDTVNGKTAAKVFMNEVRDSTGKLMASVAPVKLNAQQAAVVKAMTENFDMETTHRAISTPWFNDLAG